MQHNYFHRAVASFALLAAVCFTSTGCSNASATTTPPRADLVGPANLKSSIYFLAQESHHSAYTSCRANQRQPFYGSNGAVIATACPAYYRHVLMEGSGLVKQKGQTLLINYIGKSKGRTIFAIIDRRQCPYGLGVRGLCLQPYISIAADLSRYKVGEVIYIPAVAKAKLQLADGTIHPGYFIVTDKGGAIRGLGRFDFFTGGEHAFADENPFRALGLAGPGHGYQYFRVKRGSKTEKDVLKFYEEQLLLSSYL